MVDQRTGAEREFEMPAACPVCGTAVVQDEGAVRVYCPNQACPARVSQELSHFVGRGGMDIEGAGWKVLEQLLQRGMVTQRGDFYRLSVEDLERNDRGFQRHLVIHGHARIEHGPDPQLMDRLAYKYLGLSKHPLALLQTDWTSRQQERRQGRNPDGVDGEAG